MSGEEPEKTIDRAAVEAEIDDLQWQFDRIFERANSPEPDDAERREMAARVAALRHRQGVLKRELHVAELAAGAEAAEVDPAPVAEVMAARQLAGMVLSFGGLPGTLRLLAQEVLGITDGRGLKGRVIATDDKPRLVPFDEPVFLIRGQDVVGGDAVRAWADLAARAGAGPDILKAARDHARRFDAWPVKKIPDLTVREGPASAAD